jgi:ATP-dependent Clp protease ATP-binding subunit ClpX
MESVMMDFMYTVPSDDTIKECVITKKVVDQNTSVDKKEEELSKSKSA